MWQCPICEVENEENLICENCGFDESTNYLQYKTIGPVPEDVAASFLEALREKDKIILCEGDTSLVVKKLKCIVCEKTWYVEEHETVNLKTCPFCGVAIWEKKKIKQTREEKRQKELNSDLTNAYDKKTRTFTVPQGYTHLSAEGLMAYRRHVEYLMIPESMMFIDMKAIKQCKRIRRIEVSRGNQYFSSVDGWLYDKETNQRLWP